MSFQVSQAKQKNPSLQRSSNNRFNSTPNLLKNQDQRKSPTKKFDSPQVLVMIPSKQSEQILKIYQWRTKTKLPIVKIQYYKFVEDYLGINNEMMLKVNYQAEHIRLNNLKIQPLFQIMYLLKESLIGFQRLFHFFGIFKITKEMILITKKMKCKVWMNPNLADYKIIPAQNEKKIIVLKSIIQHFKSKCQKSALSIQFFQYISQATTIFNTIDKIQHFSQIKYIIIPTYYKQQQRKIKVSRNSQNNEVFPQFLSSKPSSPTSPTSPTTPISPTFSNSSNEGFSASLYRNMFVEGMNFIHNINSKEQTEAEIIQKNRNNAVTFKSCISVNDGSKNENRYSNQKFHKQKNKYLEQKKQKFFKDYQTRQDSIRNINSVEKYQINIKPVDNFCLMQNLAPILQHQNTNYDEQFNGQISKMQKVNGKPQRNFLKFSQTKRQHLFNEQDSIYVSEGDTNSQFSEVLKFSFNQDQF